MILVIRTVDKSEHPQSAKAGDVLVGVPDDWTFSPAELAHPDYRFIRIPLTAVEYAALISPDIDPIKQKIVRAKKYQVDIGEITKLAPHVIHDLSRRALATSLKK